MTEPVTLWGLPHSLYTGKARAYLRKQRIAYVERPPGDPRFAEVIVPAIGRGIVPVVEFPDGEIVQDTVAIIDRFERDGVPHTAYPPGPRQRVVAHLVELYAVLALTRHAMHYRWSYLDDQRAFLEDAFAAGADGARAEAVMVRMQGYLPMLGVTAETIPAIEASFAALLATLDAHFADHPYLLGHQPSIGDYALFGPLFAHLGRDPVPAAIMKRTAPRVFRWTERMHAPDADAVEYPPAAPGFLAGDAIPETLAPLLRQIAQEMTPDLLDRLRFLEAYVAEGMAVPGAPVTAKPHQRVIGEVDTSFRGVPYRGGVQPYTMYLWQRLLDAAADVPGFGAEHGLAGILDARLPIRMERQGHGEVWGAPAA